MKYYGINKRVKVINNDWEGPSIKLINKSKEEEEERKYLEEEVVHVAYLDMHTLGGDVQEGLTAEILEMFKVRRDFNGYGYTYYIKGKRGELIKYFGSINEEENR